MIERMLIAYRGEGAGQSQNEARSLLLPEPRAGKPQAFLLAGDVLQEVHRFKRAHLSWIVGGELVTDGGVYLSTPVDPLFVVLPVVEKSAKREAGATDGGYFCSLDQILENGSDRFPHLQLLEGVVRPQLHCICDVKTSDDLEFYRLNNDRVLAWLLTKVQLAQDALCGALGGLDSDSRLAYVLGFLGDYLADHWTSMLAKHLGVDMAAVSGSASAGITRIAGDMFSREDADKKPRLDPKEAAKLAARKKAEEARNLALAKVAQGTKSITSFFKPRGK